MKSTVLVLYSVLWDTTSKCTSLRILRLLKILFSNSAVWEECNNKTNWWYAGFWPLAQDLTLQTLCIPDCASCGDLWTSCEDLGTSWCDLRTSCGDLWASCGDLWTSWRSWSPVTASCSSWPGLGSSPGTRDTSGPGAGAGAGAGPGARWSPGCCGAWQLHYGISIRGTVSVSEENTTHKHEDGRVTQYSHLFSVVL